MRLPESLLEAIICTVASNTRYDPGDGDRGDRRSARGDPQIRAVTFYFAALRFDHWANACRYFCMNSARRIAHERAFFRRTTTRQLPI